LSAQCMQIARDKDTGTLQYDIYFNHDESKAVVIERYRDSKALAEHGVNLGELSEAIFATDPSPARRSDNQMTNFPHGIRLRARASSAADASSVQT
jgi:hypothetical protein